MDSMIESGLLADTESSPEHKPVKGRSVYASIVDSFSMGVPSKANSGDMSSCAPHKSASQYDDFNSNRVECCDEDGNTAADATINFSVCSLGSCAIDESDLTPENSPRAVNQAIVDLATGRGDVIDNVSRWGDGKSLVLQIDDRDMHVIDPDQVVVLCTQPIAKIRVWGVGRDCEYDFAYVARDSSGYTCHVFRCSDAPARVIANTLRDACHRILQERKQKERTSTSPDNGDDAVFEPEQHASFPHSVEEPRKVVSCFFVGATNVTRPTGMAVLNDAIERLVTEVPEDRWTQVDVAIAPSTVLITRTSDDTQLAECRVRYLSFLGIGQDVRNCAFIVHTSNDTFLAYVFRVLPSAGAMTKTLEAACKLRYQKVLDAYGDQARRPSNVSTGSADFKNLEDTAHALFASFAGSLRGAIKGFSNAKSPSESAAS